MSTSHESEVMSTDDRMIYMVNQIARNLAAQGPERSVQMVADHIRDFWDPSMKRRIVALAKDRPAALSAIASEAIARITIV